MQAMQMLNQLRSNPNPMGMMQQMCGQDPMFQQALGMAQGKSPQEIQQTVINLAKTKGIPTDVLQGFMQQFGIC